MTSQLQVISSTNDPPSSSANQNNRDLYNMAITLADIKRELTDPLIEAYVSRKWIAKHREKLVFFVKENTEIKI